ncbi:MauE/DoxX family redox-associated membrane protein [Rubritalea sp.]|uniref:MauE/DoxX family redox-associated membrane protein n=1 Tax=Rubritalea sp. TaxID=2109375 RepID=UPI003EF45C36
MVLTLLRVLLALVFLLFGGAKLFDVQNFVQNVANFQIAPFDAVPYDMWLAYFLPPLEVIVGICLLAKFWLRGALLISLGMTLAFMVGIGSVWARGLNIDCGCTGGSVSLGGYGTHMFILATMLGVGVYLVIDTIFPSEKTIS